MCLRSLNKNHSWDRMDLTQGESRKKILEETFKCGGICTLHAKSLRKSPVYRGVNLQEETVGLRCEAGYVMRIRKIHR